MAGTGTLASLLDPVVQHAAEIHLQPAQEHSPGQGEHAPAPSLLEAVRATVTAVLWPSWLLRLAGLAPPLTAAAPGLPCAWHPSEALLAVATPSGAVDLHDVPELGGGLGGTRPTAPLQPSLQLSYHLQQGVGALAWHPCASRTLAVGCRGGVCVWGRGKMPPGGATFARVVLSTGRGAAWMRKLPVGGGGDAVTALSWSPDGRLLAAGTPQLSRIHVFDLARWRSATVHTGSGGVTALAWSPCGGRLFAAGRGGFAVWDTATWAQEAWTNPGEGGAAGAVTACWSPSGDAVVVCTRGQPTLAGAYFLAAAPSLEAQLLPLSAPLAPLPGTSTGDLTLRSCVWSAAAGKLAAACSGSSGSSRSVALFDASRQPLLALRFRAWLRGPDGEALEHEPAGRSGGAEGEEGESPGEEGSQAQGGGGAVAPAPSGAGAYPILAFSGTHGVLAVRWSPTLLRLYRCPQ